MNIENIKNKEEMIVKAMIWMIGGQSKIASELMPRMVAVVKENGWVDKIGFSPKIAEDGFEVNTEDITDEMLITLEPVYYDVLRKGA